MLREVTLLTARFWPERHGGVEERMWQLAQALARRGWQVQVVTENRLGAPPVERLGERITILRLPALEPGRLWRWLVWLHVWWWLRALRAIRPAGVVWATDPTIGAAAVVAGYGRRLIYNPAACAPAMNSIGRAYPHIDTMQIPKPWEWLDRLAYRKAAAIILSSHNLRRQFARFFGERRSIGVIGLGVAAPAVMSERSRVRRRLGMADADFVVGFVGRLDPCKDVGFLFDAVGRGDRSACDRILIVGDGPDRRRLERLAHESGVEERVVWAGAARQPFELYPAMDAFVLPSLYEAFGQVLLEAMAAGVPVLGRAPDDRIVLNAMDEIIQHGRTGFITAAHDAGDLSARLQWLRDHPAERSAMGRAAERFARSRSWDAVAEALEAIVEQVVAARAPAHEVGPQLAEV